MTKEQQLKELTDIVHDGSYHEEETAEDIYNAGYRKAKHGKWEFIGTDKISNVFKCSNCALRIGLQKETDYCPNCGARMFLEE